MKRKSRILYFGGCVAAAGAISASTVLILASQGYIDIQPNNKNTSASANSRIVPDSDNNDSAELARLKKAIEEKDKTINDKNQMIQTKDKTIEGNEKTIKSKDADIKTKDADIKTKDADIKAKDADIKTKDADIKLKDSAIKTRDKTIDALTPRIKYENAPKGMDVSGVDWTGAFAYKDGTDKEVQYVVTKNGVFEYDVTTPDEFSEYPGFDAIGDPTDGFMFQGTPDFDIATFIGTKNGLWVQNLAGDPAEQVAKGDFTNTNMLETGELGNSKMYLYDKSGVLKEVSKDAVTGKWSISSTPEVTNLPKNAKGMKTVRATSSDAPVTYIYGDDGITAVSFSEDNFAFDTEKITSKPVKNIEILANEFDIKNTKSGKSAFTLGIIFDNSVGFMEAMGNSGTIKNQTKTIKEIQVEDDLTDAKLMFIKDKDERKMIPALITKGGVKIFVGTGFYVLKFVDESPENADFTKSLVFDTSSLTVIVGPNGLKTINLIHSKPKPYTSSSVNIYQK